jgi:hypothetical protein
MAKEFNDVSPLLDELYDLLTRIKALEDDKPKLVEPTEPTVVGRFPVPAHNSIVEKDGVRLLTTLQNQMKS